MRASVFTDKALAKHAGRFVWLSIDHEKAENAAFVEKFKTQSMPTLWVIDSATETAALRWLGSANVPQLERLFDDGERAVKHAKEGGATTPEDLLARADRAMGEGKTEDAVKAFKEAHAAAPPDWPNRPRVVESLVGSLYTTGDMAACAGAAREEAGELPRGSSFLNVTAMGLSCALNGDNKATWRAEALSILEPLLREAVLLPGLLADDRSGGYEVLVECRKTAGDAEGVKRAASEWIVFLEGEAARATTPEARTAFDPHRVVASLALGEPGRALAALQQTEKDLPNDYNAPARQAILYQEMGRYDDALAAVDRALAKVYGPRKLRVLKLRSGILAKKGDKEAAARTLDEAVAYAATLPAAQRPPERIIEGYKAEAAKLRAK